MISKDFKSIYLSKNERIVAIVPEKCSGPGWVNNITWVYIEDETSGRIRTDCIQPLETTKELHTLFSIGEEVYKGLLASIPTNKEI